MADAAGSPGDRSADRSADRTADGTADGTADRPAPAGVSGARRKAGAAGGSRLFSENRREWLAALSSIVVTVGASAGFRHTDGPWVPSLISWNVLAVSYAALSWVLFLRAGPDQVEAWALHRARPVQGLLRRSLHGRSATTSLWFIGTGSFYGVVSAGYVLPRAADIEPGAQALLTGLGVASIATSWFAAHTAYTLHYAFQYYRVGGRGLEFQGDERPNLVDFAYFSFGVGKTFGATDIAVSTRAMRRTVLLHGLYAFVFNTAILAVALSYVASR